MTQRQNLSQSKRSFTRWADRDRLRGKRRKNRQSLLESLENRQLLAGPDLIGVQPNQGSLLFESPVQNSDPVGGLDVLQVAPRELVFRFNDDARLDPATVSGIRITRAGEDRVFESATATSDLGTNGQVLLEFRAAQDGTVGNGVTITLTSSSRPNATPGISVNGRNVNIDLSNNPLRPTRVQDLITAVEANAQASGLVEVIQVSGSALGTIGTSVTGTTVLTLRGANAAQAVTDFGTAGEVRVRLVAPLPGPDSLGTEIRVERRDFGGPANPAVVVSENVVRVQLNSSPGNETTAGQFIAALNNNPDAADVVFAVLEQGQLDTVIGDLPTSYSPLVLSGVSDVVIEPGYVGLGDSPREVVFRFAEPLPDDTYQIDIFGSGPLALANVNGEPFQDGVDLSRKFRLNLGPQVVAVVPEPVRRNANGGLTPGFGKIDVHFNDDDLDPASATNPTFYQLIYTRDTVDNTDDAVVVPNSVSYNPLTNIATLDFGGPLSRISDPADPPAFLTGAARLRVGTNAALPAPPTEIDLTLTPDAGDSFTSATGLVDPATGQPIFTPGVSGTQSARLTSEIFNASPFELEFPGPDLPGTRSIRPEDPSRLNRTVPLDYVRFGADAVDGTSVIQYNFRSSWLGDDPNRPGVSEDTTYFNIISEQQKQRVREALQLYSEYLGVSFVEVEGAPTISSFFSIAVGDLYGGDERATSGDGGLAVVTRDTNGDGLDDLAVMDFQDFDESTDDQFGGEFFRGGMFAVGQLLGYGYADDLPQPVTQSTDFIFSPGSDNEAAFPSVADIIHGQYLYRPDSTDIDLYSFRLDSPGTLSIETIAERLAAPSLLDTALRVYRADASGSFQEIAFNDDYFSNDSLVSVEVEAGNYMVGVSAKGNTDYDPSIPGTGIGGRSEGEYELRIDFTPRAVTSITDRSGVALDGDADGHAGGAFDFWFVPANPNDTIYVDKAAGSIGGGAIGTIGNPYREIDLAIAAADPGDTIRVVGNGGADGRVETVTDNLTYQIGFAENGTALQDGTTLNLPQGVRMVIDSGAILKLSRSRIGVGSVSPLVDVSDSALQVLGTPTVIGANGLPARDASGAIIPGSVYFTSINDDSLGAPHSATLTPAPRQGDWGGIDFRGDLDAADELRRNRELEGVFLNHIQFADLRYGGGSVSVGGRQVVVSPIDMAVTRPTIMNSQISLSADAAIAATPSSFTETRFTDTLFQSSGIFTPDYSRVGPEIHGNTIVGNSINGLFVRVQTRTGDVLQTVDTSARFDDLDITHVLTENLGIKGTPGGPILISSAPSALLIKTTPAATGSVPAGTYVYRVNNVSNAGLESAASQPTVPVTLTATGGIQLSQLPTIGTGSEFVARRLYRAEVDPATGLPGEFRRVALLNASATAYLDQAAAGGALLQSVGPTLQSRLDASLKIDPGAVLKIDGARIETRFGANLIAEGQAGLPVVFTSLQDQRYGGGGTFDTRNQGSDSTAEAGDWGGIYIGHGSTASLDHAVIAGAGGTTRIEGEFASFNPIEVHQGELRLANSRLENNADGTELQAGTRVGRGENTAATIFVRGATPIILDNEFVGGQGPAISIDLNSLSSTEVNDHGRATGNLGRVDVVGNAGPLVQGNALQDNSINGMQVRGGELTTAGVWDDFDIVHVVNDAIEVPNQHILGGLQLQSDARGSLVVKFQSDPGESAGIVAGGTLLSGAEQFRDIADRIGGSLQIIGQPDFPVVLTTLADDTVGAGFTIDGRAQVDTNNDGFGELPDGFLPTLPTGPEVNNGTLIDNDVDPTIPGSFSYQPGPGGVFQIGTPNQNVLTTVQGLTQVFQQQLALFAYGFFVDVGADGGAIGLETTTITQQPTLVADDLVVSEGNFQGANGLINWRIEQTFIDGRPDLISNISFTSDQPLGDLRFINYYDPVIGTDSGDILFTEGTNGANDFRLTILDGPEEIGFRQYGTLEPGPGLVNATYEGWIADDFPDLITAPVFNLPFVPGGTVDGASVPTLNDPRFPVPNYGPGILTSALAWTTDTNATSASFTTNLELIAEVFGTQAPQVDAGLWEGVTVREAANDRNVAAFAENEPVRTSIVDGNSIPSQSQFLGEIAPNEQSGDENRRLGFVINGTVSTRDDVDVYSFVAESGTEVWLDIDKTSSQLDSVVELINANGEVLAISNDSFLANSGTVAEPSANPLLPGINADAPQPLSLLADSPTQDAFSTNPKDAGMRIRLPGEAGTRNLYHVRVRSSNVAEPTAANALANLMDPTKVRNGLTLGSYELQVRLQETDEVPGTQVRLADVKYATNGLRIIGQPLHSPLLGEEYETSASNDLRQDAQPLGYHGVGNDASITEAGPLQSDRLAKSFAGQIDSATDVDWYRFEIDYDNLTRDGARLYLSTVFDLDYADNFARSDMALYVFDSAGRLVLIGGDSNIADDLPGSPGTNDTTDLSRGSAGSEDPYIGAAELSEGTYYVAVSNQQQVPLPMDQFFNENSSNPLLRLEPVDSVRRIAEDRINSFGGGTASAPEVPVLFDNNSIVPYSFDDVLLYVNTVSGLFLVNPFTGQNYGSVGGFGDEIRDIAFHANGELFAYSGFGNRQPGDANWFYHRIDTSNGQLSAALSTGAGMTTVHDLDAPADADLVLDVQSDDGMEVEGITIRAFEGQETGFFVGNRPTPRPGLAYTTNVLYEFDERTGLAIGPNFDLSEAAPGAGTSIREIGRINTPVSDTVTGIEIVGNTLYAVTDAGELYLVSNAELNANDSRTVGQLVNSATDLLGLEFTGLRAGPNNQVVNGIDLTNVLFGTTRDGTIYAFNTAGQLQPVFAGGNTSISTGIGGALGLDFSIVDFNLWHTTNQRQNDAGHGINPLFNGTRGRTNGGTSLAFSYENDAFASRYASGSERPVQTDGNGNITNPRQDGTTVEDSYNIPGGVKGVVQSNTFSLSGYAANDQPTMYFNYFLGIEDDDNDNDADNARDTLRVYVITEDGVQHLVATNNLDTEAGLTNDEFDDPPQSGDYADDIDLNVQQLYRNQGWRQARVSLNDFAGERNLSLRIEYATAGTAATSSPTLRAVPGDVLIEGEQIVIGGQTFEIDLAPSLSLPSGSELASLYANPAELAVVTINGQDYVLDDGTRTVTAPQITVDLLAGLPAGTTLNELTAAQLASALADAITITPPPAPATSAQVDGSLLELAGDSSVSATPTTLFQIGGQEPITGIPVPVSRFMSAAEVAEQLQLAVANQFHGGNVSAVPTAGTSVSITGLALGDAGPFGDESERYGDRFAAGIIAGSRDNAHEGVYLDDFIIGFAERGEIATASNNVNGGFVTDTRPQFPNPDDPTSNLLTGSYQVEIRDASEYVNSLSSSRFRTFDTNDRLSDSRSITVYPADQLRDGQTFTISDGRSLVTFEFDLEELNNGVTPGNVRVPFSLVFTDPDTGLERPNTAAEIAAALIEAINRSDVQSVIDVPALPSSGIDSLGDTTINLFGDVVVDNSQNALAAVDQATGRGDDNRDRDGQGVILVENSRFLFNQEYGINVSHDLTVNINGTDTNSIIRYPRNLVELNTESLAPGVVIQSNVIAYNDIGGLQIAGISPTVGETGRDPVSFERIVNNTIVGGTVTPGIQSPPSVIGGILFEQGAISFADAVFDYVPDAGGAPPETAFQVATRALGAPDGGGRGPEPTDGQTTVSLGLGGTLTLQFTDNLLTGSGDARPDLIVFETGAVESVRVEVSRDGVSFLNVGTVGGLSNQVDLDAFGFGTEDRFSFVRLTDLRQGDTDIGPLGADIDAVGALSTVPVESFEPGGTGINVTGNAAPTLLNNVIANSEQAIALGLTAPASVLGGNTFYRNTNNVPAGVSVGEFAQVLSDNEVVFVAAADGIFAPAAGARIIDSSIDSLEDRPSLTAVKNPLGLPPSPVLAPEFDVNGQLRVDDPNVQTPSGLGERVFKDRGAFDRGDLVGPRAVLLSPQAPGLGDNAGAVTAFGQAPDAFEIQLIDGLSPADVVPGTGIDDRSVSKFSVVLLQDNEPLVEGVDYRFSYNPSTNVIRLTPIAGIWEPDSTYVVRMVGPNDDIVSAVNGVNYVDGSMLDVIDLSGQATTFEYETGIGLTLAATLPGSNATDGITLNVFDGVNTVTFELDTDGTVGTGNLAVTVDVDDEVEVIGAAIAEAINASTLNLTAVSAGDRVQLLDGTPLATVGSSSGLVVVSGKIGTSVGFGIGIPANGSLPANSVQDGQTFTIRRGATNAVTFELDTTGSVTTAGAVPVEFPANATLDQIADSIVRAISGTTLGLVPENVGFGRVFLGGDANYSLDLSGSTLTQLGAAGTAASLPIEVRVDQTAAEVAQTIADAINAAPLPGVSATTVDKTVFLEGTDAVSGTGAVNAIVIQDEVGNPLQSNQPNGRTELTIFVGSGNDYGDAPAPYVSRDADGGPRHQVDPTFSFGPTVTADADAILPNGDLSDDGIALLGTLQTGFSTNLQLTINNVNNRAFFVDAWYDWNGDGVFEASEQEEYDFLGTGTNIVRVDVPPDAKVGEIYARFRLSEQSNLGPTGDATSGEVEDIRLLVTNNPFQNPVLKWDVNGSGAVTPIDAVQIVNALNRNGEILLDSPPLPALLPMFPDVNGDGRVTSIDAISVVNQLRLMFNGEGEVTTSTAAAYTPVASGVLASDATIVGSALIEERIQKDDTAAVTEVPSEIAKVEKVSVFDDAAVIQLDTVVDSLAEDTAASRGSAGETNVLDELFANL